MEVFREIPALRHKLKEIRKKDAAIGFVPTMGALHKGHLSLISQSVEENDFTICSIFVNPVQFNNIEDLKHYPRPHSLDIEMLGNYGCDLVFYPDENVMYPAEPQIVFNFGELENTMEGKYRPGHFSGVGLVVAKLFNITMPDAAYFGKKDLQQFAVIQSLVKELNFDIHLRCCDTIREHDGLAMSSRNVRLSDADRQAAPKLYEVLCLGKEMLQKGVAPSLAQMKMTEFLKKNGNFVLEYIEIVDSENLKTVTDCKNHSTISICVAAWLGNVRLIDNITVF
ncbi:MAG: pantoate--beta-alanine ligase [Cyclobacteriaceae bacterium]|nr:pantoate--beta-alanine ligase [Cyclobacteriaceae bacterium]